MSRDYQARIPGRARKRRSRRRRHVQDDPSQPDWPAGFKRQNRPRSAPGVPVGSILSLYDPSWNRYYDWGSDQVLTPNGTVEFSVRNGSLAMETRTNASFLSGASMPFANYDDASPFVVYFVGEYEDLGYTFANMWQLSGANVLDGSVTAAIRKGGGTGVGALMFSDGGAFAQDYHGGAAAEGTVYFGACVFGASELEALVSIGGALVGNGSVAKAASPTLFTKFTIGGSNTATGQVQADGSKVHWCEVVRGARALSQHQEVADWAASEFPVGETIS